VNLFSLHTKPIGGFTDTIVDFSKDPHHYYSGNQGNVDNKNGRTSPPLP